MPLPALSEIVLDAPACALHAAAFEDDCAKVRRCVLKDGLAPDVRDAWGRTALFVARSTAMVRLLLALGVPPDARDAEGLDAPAYWAIRPSPPFRAQGHAILIKAWPEVPSIPDWHARCRTAATMRPVVLRRELNRWGGVPASPLPSASFLATGARVILETDVATHADAERLLMLAECGEDRAVEVEGAPAALWALLALHHCPEAGQAVRGGSVIRGALWRDWLTSTSPRAGMDAALERLACWGHEDRAHRLRVRLAASAAQLRGRFAYGRLAASAAGVREDERARWLAWGLSGVLALSTRQVAIVGAEASTLGAWSSAARKAAHARAPLPGTPWGPLFWALAHLHGESVFERTMTLLHRLIHRGATIALEETQASAWQKAEAAWDSRRSWRRDWIDAMAAWRRSQLMSAELPSAPEKTRPRL